MSRSWRAAGVRCSVLAVGLAASACHDEFALGSWGVAPTPNATATATGTATSTATSTGTMEPPPPPPPGPPECGDLGKVGALNPPGGPGAVGATKLFSDWIWPSAIESIEWDLVMETDPESDGYYWAHQFSFAEGVPGYFGIQAYGGYQEDPTPTPTMPMGSPFTFVKMALLWIGGASKGEVGDIPFPDARAAIVTKGGVDWMTLHAKFEWDACHLYHLKLARHSVSEEGDNWYGFWIQDLTTDVETFIGRVLVPGSAGPILSLTTSYTTRIDLAGENLLTCQDPEPASGIFGTPTANDGALVPTTRRDRFAEPTRCPSSRFTELANGVRHEIGLRLPAP